MAVRAKKKKVDTQLRIETLKADVDRLRSTIQLIEKAYSRAAFINDAKLQKRIMDRLRSTAEVCAVSAADKVEKAKELALAEIEESAASYEGGKGARRLER